MCQYSSVDGAANDWHLVHLGGFALGGAALIIMEATAVEAIGRISASDSGLYSENHVAPLKRITEFLHDHGAIAGIQLAHAGRKASRTPPWEGDSKLEVAKGGWEPVGPSALTFGPGYDKPRELTISEITHIVECFGQSARRAFLAGFRWIEIHAAHGYLIHSFLSPASNLRTDSYGGSFENRTRILREIIEAVQRNWPSELPLTVRLSCTDYTEGGWTLDDSISLSKQLKAWGVDLVDCSSGGNVKAARIPVGPGYQVPFAEAIRKNAEIPTAAVGMITEALQAEQIIKEGKADLVLLARQMLRDPHWAFGAMKTLIENPTGLIVPQYQRSFL